MTQVAQTSQVRCNELDQKLRQMSLKNQQLENELKRVKRDRTGSGSNQEQEGSATQQKAAVGNGLDAVSRDRARFWAVMGEMFFDEELCGGRVPTAQILEPMRYKDPALRLECRRAEYFDAMPPILHRLMVAADPIFMDVVRIATILATH